MNVQILIFDGFDELDAIGPYEIWRMAADVQPKFSVLLVSLDGAREITAANGLHVRAEAKLAATRPDLVVVPGGGWLNRALAGAWAEAQRGSIPTTLAQLHREATTLASVCTGAMLLAAAGLLKDRPATTNHAAVEELRAMGARVISARVVDDGDIVTAGGITCGLDLTLWLVERFAGAEIAHVLEQHLEYERRGTVWKRPK